MVLSLCARSLNTPGILIGATMVTAAVGCAMSPSQTAGLKTLTPEQHPVGVSLVNVFVQAAACVAPSLFIGIMSDAQVSGVVELGKQAAAGLGFSQASAVAAVIALVGTAVATVYALAMRRGRTRGHAHKG